MNPRPFDPQALIETLARHHVDHLLIGGLGAVLHGSSAMTNDADIMPDTSGENLERLAAALRELDARLRVDDEPDGIEFDPHPALLGSVSMLNLTTRFGDLDIAMRPAAMEDHRRLAASAVEFDVGGVTVKVAALDDIIASKEAADRPKDHATLPILHALRDEIALRERRGD